MTKSELINWLQEKHQQWEALLDQVGPARIEQPGVNGYWSMKDMVAHLTVWNRWLVARLQAAAGDMPETSPPWPANLETEDEINAWIYEAYHERPASEVLEESRQVFQELLAAVESLPEDARCEQVEPEYQLVWVGDQRFLASEFFNHFHDDHEPDVHAWLRRVEESDSAYRRAC